MDNSTRKAWAPLQTSTITPPYWDTLSYCGEWVCGTTEKMRRVVQTLPSPPPRLSEKVMAPHSSTLAWKIPWTEEPGRLQSMGLRRVGHDWATSLSLFTFMRWRRQWQPPPVFLPGGSQGQGSLLSCRLWGPQSRTWLKRLSSSSSSSSTWSPLPIKSLYQLSKLNNKQLHTQWFKSPYIDYLTVFKGQESGPWLSWALAQGFHKAVIKVSGGLCPFLEPRILF